MPGYAAALLDALREPSPALAGPSTPGRWSKPLPGELEVLKLVAQGLSNEEIGERLFLSLSTVKGHNRNIFDKLQVQRRTEAVALELASCTCCSRFENSTRSDTKVSVSRWASRSLNRRAGMETKNHEHGQKDVCR